MQVAKKYLYFILILLAVNICGIFLYIKYHNNVPSSYELGIYKDRIDSLNTETMRLNHDVLYREKLDSIRLKRLDSLSVENKRLFESRELLKKKITIYDTFKSVDINASADSMRSVLSEAGFR